LPQLLVKLQQIKRNLRRLNQLTLQHLLGNMAAQ